MSISYIVYSWDITFHYEKFSLQCRTINILASKHFEMSSRKTPKLRKVYKILLFFFLIFWAVGCGLLIVLEMIFFLHFLKIFFFLFMANLQHMKVPGLCHSHSNTKSEPHLQPTLPLAATPDP